MNLNEFTSAQPVVEAQLVWARKGNKIVRKYRCSVGQRAGRVVSDPSQCGKPIDIKKRMGSKMTRKALKTKRMNPASKAIQRLNKVK